MTVHKYISRIRQSHTFNGRLSGTTRVSRYQKGKTNLDFTEARDSKWQWHQLGHNHASAPSLSFYRPGVIPDAQPTASKHRQSMQFKYPYTLFLRNTNWNHNYSPPTLTTSPNCNSKTTKQYLYLTKCTRHHVVQTLILFEATIMSSTRWHWLAVSYP